jgi:hypothetical protein
MARIPEEIAQRVRGQKAKMPRRVKAIQICAKQSVTKTLKVRRPHNYNAIFGEQSSDHRNESLRIVNMLYDVVAYNCIKRARLEGGAFDHAHVHMAT